MDELDNTDKSLHGINAKDSLEQVLKECECKKYIKEIEKKYRCGYADYDDRQFYCNFLIRFYDDVKWILNITTSLRDRVKEQQWDSFHIKLVDKRIDKSILVYPDSINLEEKDKFISYKLRIHSHQTYSAIDDVVSQRELYDMIQSYAIRSLSTGKRNDLIGNDFEAMIASILSNRENYEKWVTGDRIKVGISYNYFEKIVSFFKLDKTKVKGINATSDKKEIGNLLSTGLPKTDIIVHVYYHDIDKETEHYTISCKKTNGKAVSVHQYTADAFADVLDSENSELRNILRKFQTIGNMRDFGENNIIALTKMLKPYKEKLIRWVLGGYGGKIQNDLQLANFILISDANDIYIHSLDEYVKELLKPEYVSHFGTPFSWTYASGRQGKDIQLKCKIIK
ncbi:MAG: MspI family type II restriction endonuclease [Treponema sp.]|nr:MspI family type II restriction endonuclease [Treponema sp.]